MGKLLLFSSSKLAIRWAKILISHINDLGNSVEINKIIIQIICFTALILKSGKDVHLLTQILIQKQ